jgi:hypothetical protein
LFEVVVLPVVGKRRPLTVDVLSIGLPAVMSAFATL